MRTSIFRCLCSLLLVIIFSSLVKPSSSVSFRPLLPEMGPPVMGVKIPLSEQGAEVKGRVMPLPASMSAEILRYVNEHRRTLHLAPLQANSFISSVALDHSRNMLSGKTAFGHDGFRERIDRIRKRIGPIRVAAENVASGPMGAREVVDGWLHSPGHRRNIEGDFRFTGIGLAYGRRGMIYFTQIFTR